MKCHKDARAARAAAAIDDVTGNDNSQAVEDAFEPDQAIHYAAYGSKLAEERGQLYAKLGVDTKLKEPGRTYANPETAKNPVYKKWAPTLDTVGKWVFGHPDFDVFPHEILGDDIVGPVRDTYRAYADKLQEAKETDAYKNRKTDPEEWLDTVRDIKEDTGYADAVTEAKEQIEDKYGDGQDPERYQYGMAWLNRYSPTDALTETNRTLTGNLVENDVKNNPLLIYRHFFDQMRVIYNLGPNAYREGVIQFLEARKNNSPELSNVHPRIDFLSAEADKSDILHKVAEWNQGVTYFAAKEHATSKGMSGKDATEYAKSAVQHLQFQTSPVDQPRVFWNGKSSLLALSKYHLLERRWYLGMWKNLSEGFAERNTPAGQVKFNNARKAIMLYAVGHALVFGASSNLPAESDFAESIFPGFREEMRKIDRYSLSGALNLNLAPYTRSPLTLVGILPRLGLALQTVKTVTDDVSAAINHPDSIKDLKKAATNAAMLAPAGFGIPGVDKIGLRNVKNFSDLMFRVFTNDYKRTTQRGKHYYTTPFEEFMNFVRGGKEGLDREIQKAQMDQAPKGKAPVHIPHPRTPKVRAIR